MRLEILFIKMDSIHYKIGGFFLIMSQYRDLIDLRGNQMV